MLYVTKRIVPAVIAFIVLCGATFVWQSAAQEPPDGPVSVHLGDVFEKGNTRIEDADLKSLPALPQGYVALNNKAYRITTTAVAVGPYTVRFRAKSVTDEDTFKNLRILHVEPERYDPDSGVWVDRTASLPNAPAPDFAQKTINAYSDELESGYYVIARLIGKPAATDAATDLQVTAKGTPESVQMPAKITMLVTVKNNGPQVANDVGTLQNLNSGMVVSIKPSQGSCKHKQFRLYCKLGQLAVGSSATIEVVVDPSGDFAGHYTSVIEVGGRSADTNGDNNQVVAEVLAHADPNAPPEVTLDTSVGEQPVEQGASVVLNATATDPNGSVTKVEFWDFDKNLGIGSTTDGKHFSFTLDSLSNGRHILFAVATDNAGRQAGSHTKHIFVNGPVKVRILEPKAETLVTPGSDLILTAEAIHPDGSIKSLEFFQVGISLGHATRTEGNRFTLKVPDIKRAKYHIEAVATDESGAVSKSPVLQLNISKRPTISITTPVEGASFTAPANIEIVLNPDRNLDVRSVELYANGVRIHEGSVMIPGKYVLNWDDVPAGNYTLKAVVIDNVDVKGESAPIQIIVKPQKGTKTTPDL